MALAVAVGEEQAITILRDMDSLKTLLKPLAEDGAQLTREQAADVLRQILSGQVPEVETAALLTVLATRGEQAPELTGFVEVMREQCVPVPLTDEERVELVEAALRTGGGGPPHLQHLPAAQPRCRGCWSQGCQAHRQSRRHLALHGAAGRRPRSPRRSDRLSPELAVECLRETGFVFLRAPALSPRDEDGARPTCVAPSASAPSSISAARSPIPRTHASRSSAYYSRPCRVLLVEAAHSLCALGSKRAFGSSYMRTRRHR